MSKKTFFITGANSGFGLAIATAASREGHMVVGTIRSEASRASLAERLPAVRSVLCDVTDFDRIPQLVAQVEADYGPVDVLINNAGYGHEGILEESPLEEMRRQFDVNVQAEHPGLLYRIVNRHLFGPGVGGVALGLSRATMDAFRAVAKDERKGIKTSAAVQSELGFAEARWRSVRAFLYQALGDMWRDIKAGQPESTAHQINVRCAATLAVHEAKAIIDFAYHEAGASAILDALPFERRVRDMFAVLQHGQSKRNNMEAVGKYMLDMDPGPLIL